MKKKILILLMLFVFIIPIFTKAADEEENPNNNEEIVNNEVGEEENKHSVTYVLDGGVCKENECINTLVYDGDILVKPSDPVKDNYDFINWYSDPEFNTLFDFNKEIKTDVVIYAKFIEKENVSITSSVNSVDFGTQIVGFKDNVVKTIIIKNTGDVDVTLNIFNPVTEGPFKSLDFEVGKTLKPNEEYEVKLLAEAGTDKGKTPNTYTGEYLITATSGKGKKVEVKIKADLRVQYPGIHVSYSLKPQSKSWTSYYSDGKSVGYAGKGRKIEALKIKLENNPYSGSIVYRTYSQNKGWPVSKTNNAVSGFSGSGLRIETMYVRLTGELQEHYDVYYRVYVQKLGWLGWARNAELAGSSGYGYRIEDIQVKLVVKGTTFSEYGKKYCHSSKSDGVYQPLKNESKVAYRVKLQKVGWQSYKAEGVTADNLGKGYRIEGIRIKLHHPRYAGNIEYRTYIQGKGWESYKKNNALAGPNKALRTEAIMIKLSGEIVNYYDVYYRVKVQNLGWLGWARNGEKAGSEGYNFRMEGIQIKLVEKGSTLKEYGEKATYFNKKTGSYTPNNGDAVKGTWQVINGKTYFIYKDGTKAKYLVKIAGIRYEFSKDGELQHSNVKHIADISVHNTEHGKIDFDKLWASGEIDGLIFRISYNIRMDTQFKNYLAEAKRLGIPYSVYIFSTAENTSEAKQEAQQIISWYKENKLSTQYGVFYDLESWYHVSTGHSSNGISVTMYDNIIKTFVTELSNAGIKASVYASKNYAETRFGNYGRSQVGWIAQYNSTCGYKGTYKGWQYTSTGTLPGITGNVDLSVFYS